MRRLPAVLVALTAAAALVLLASPVSAAGARTFKTDPGSVRAGQRIKVIGKGCRSRGYVRIYLDGIEIDNDRADRAGVFVDYVEIPVSVDIGKHAMKAGCNGQGSQVGRHQLVEHADQQGRVERLALERERGRLGRRHLDRPAAVAEQPRPHGPVAAADGQTAGAAGHEGPEQAAHGRRQLARLEVDERARRRVSHVDRPPPRTRYPQFS